MLRKYIIALASAVLLAGRQTVSLPTTVPHKEQLRLHAIGTETLSALENSHYEPLVQYVNYSFQSPRYLAAD